MIVSLCTRGRRGRNRGREPATRRTGARAPSRAIPCDIACIARGSPRSRVRNVRVVRARVWPAWAQVVAGSMPRRLFVPATKHARTAGRQPRRANRSRNRRLLGMGSRPRQRAGLPVVIRSCAAAYRTSAMRGRAHSGRDRRDRRSGSAIVSCRSDVARETALVSALHSRAPWPSPIKLSCARVPRDLQRNRQQRELALERSR